MCFVRARTFIHPDDTLLHGYQSVDVVVTIISSVPLCFFCLSLVLSAFLSLHFNTPSLINIHTHTLYQQRARAERNKERERDAKEEEEEEEEEGEKVVFYL